MERALDEINKPYKLVVQPIKINDTFRRKLESELAAYKGLILYKLHGSLPSDEFGSEEPTSILITEDDYIDFLSTMANGEGIAKPILAKLIDSLWLILGYSLKDWDFRMLIRTLPLRLKRTKIAIFRDNPSGFWIEYLRVQGIVHYNIDIYEFTKQLNHSYHKKYGF